MLVKQCVRELPKLRMISSIPHNEYAAHFRNQAYLLDSDSLELPYWMFRFEEMSTSSIAAASRTPTNPTRFTR